MNKYNLNYITIFDFLNFFDYLFAIINSFKKKKFDTKRIVLNNINLEYLFNDLYQKTFNDINSFSSNLQFLFFKNLKKKTDDSKFYRIIDWYENQSTDKGFNFGLNKFFPKTQSIGYQPFAVDFDFYSHLISTKTERTNNITPNKIALMGQKIKIYLSKKFKLPSKKIILAPSLRYKSIFDKKKLIYKIKKTKYILLALPISYQDSSDILRVVQNYLKKFKKNNYKFFINFHPMLDIKKLRNNYKFIDKNIEIIQGSFNEIQSRFDCIISNSSSICFEALALSKPVLVVQNSKGITQNPISMVKKDTWEFIKNENDLQKAFIRLLIKKKKQSFINNSKFIKKKYFFEINRKNIIKFLGLS